MKALEKLLDPEIIWALIPIVAIIGYFVNKVLKSHYAHVERLEKIRSGIDPDHEE